MCVKIYRNYFVLLFLVMFFEVLSMARHDSFSDGGLLLTVYCGAVETAENGCFSVDMCVSVKNWRLVQGDPCLHPTWDGPCRF